LRGDKIIEVEDVWYKYPTSEDWVLRGVSFDVRRGEFFSIIGPTGAGKTTLAMALNGLVPHYTMGEFKGRIKVAGLDTLRHRTVDLARKVGLVFQDPESQLIMGSVEEELLFGQVMRGASREDALKEAYRVADIMGIRDLMKRHPRNLSGGQKQRVAIAATLVTDPEVLVLDEATSDLDPIGVRSVFQLCSKLNKEYGKTIVMISHEVEYLAEYSDRIMVMDEGEVKLVGAPEEVFGRWRELNSLGIRLPQVVEFAVKARSNGLQFNILPLTVEEAYQEISRRIVKDG